eukprot:SAG31_NODE_6707_length_1917_cov_1.268427_5_plen_68_part_01
MVAMILARTLNQDIAKYERLDGDEYAEETGWKLVHGEHVFATLLVTLCFVLEQRFLVHLSDVVGVANV